MMPWALLLVVCTFLDTGKICKEIIHKFISRKCWRPSMNLPISVKTTIFNVLPYGPKVGLKGLTSQHSGPRWQQFSRLLDSPADLVGASASYLAPLRGKKKSLSGWVNANLRARLWNFQTVCQIIVPRIIKYLQAPMRDLQYLQAPMSLK